MNNLLNSTGYQNQRSRELIEGLHGRLSSNPHAAGIQVLRDSYLGRL